jgi:hypothetical protein
MSEAATAWKWKFCSENERMKVSGVKASLHVDESDIWRREPRRVAQQSPLEL